MNKKLFLLMFGMIFLFGILASVSALTIPYDNYQIFNTTGSNTFTIPIGLTNVTILVIGGGGGAGALGGGGGAGGVIYNTSYFFNSSEISSSNVNLYVGKGGTGGVGNDGSTGTNGNQGENSIFGTKIAIGGGYGGGGAATNNKPGHNGGSGGSGGGGGHKYGTGSAGTGGTGTSGQGTNGGNGADGTNGGGGGNGSAGSTGGAGSGASYFGDTWAVGGYTAWQNAANGTGNGGGVPSSDGGNGGNGIIIVAWNGNYPTIIINSPANNSLINTSSFTINATISNIDNVSIYVNGIFNQVNTSGTNGIYLFPISGLSSGNYNYTLMLCKSSSCSNITRTITVDIDAPSVVVSSPVSSPNYLYQNYSLNLNFTATDPHLSTCIWNYNGTNTTIVCSSGVLNSSNFLYQRNVNNGTLFVNDSLGNKNNTLVSWSPKIFEFSRNFSNVSLETAHETYSINLTANASLTNVYLNYSGVSYPTTYSNGVWSYSSDIASGAIGNNSLNWIMTYGGTNYSSYTSYQNVSSLIFTLCNASYSTPYLNVTFKDESTLSSVSGTLQSSTWSYYLGDGLVNKTYTYNTASNFSNYTFCSNAGSRNLYTLPYVNYLGDGYPNRIWEPSLQTYTSSSLTNQTLYLLASTDGIYVTFVTVTTANTALSGSTVLVSRTISGSTVYVAQGTTDSSGAFTAWLNPNYAHTVYASKTGYGSVTETIQPTQSSYTLILGSSGNYSYVSNVNGLLWGYFPRGQLTATSTNFGFNVTSVYDNIQGCEIEVLNDNKTIILASGTTVPSNNSFCSVETTYTPSVNYPTLRGRLLVDIGDGYQILEEDAYWNYLPYNTTGMTFTDWFQGLKNDSLTLRYFTGGSDPIKEQHREYTYILLFFLIVTIIASGLNMAGWDNQQPGAMMFLVGGLIWVASVPGFLTLSGISPFAILDKYYLALIYTMFMVGFAGRLFS